MLTLGIQQQNSVVSYVPRVRRLMKLTVFQDDVTPTVRWGIKSSSGFGCESSPFLFHAVLRTSLTVNEMLGVVSATDFQTNL